MDRRFFNPSQPQTMQVSVFLLYANVILALFFSGSEGLYAVAATSLTGGGGRGSGTTLIGNLVAIGVVAGCGAAAYLIANERKVGWRLGVVVAAAPIVALLLIIVTGHVSVAGAISIRLLFDVALLVALLHDQTRSYEKIWFK